MEQELFYSDSSEKSKNDTCSVNITINSEQNINSQQVDNPQKFITKKQQFQEKRQRTKDKIYQNKNYENIKQYKKIQKLDLKTRNRLSAQRSRDKAKEFLQILQQNYQQLNQENLQLKQQISNNICSICSLKIHQPEKQQVFLQQQEIGVKQNQNQQNQSLPLNKPPINNIKIEIDNQQSQSFQQQHFFLQNETSDSLQNFLNSQNSQNSANFNEIPLFQSDELLLDNQENINENINSSIANETQIQFFREQSSNSFNLINFLPKNVFHIFFMTLLIFLIAIPAIQVLDNQSQSNLYQSQLIKNLNQDPNITQNNMFSVQEHKTAHIISDLLQPNSTVVSNNSLLNINQDREQRVLQIPPTILSNENTHKNQDYQQQIFCPYSFKFDPLPNYPEKDTKYKENNNFKIYLNGQGLQQFGIKQPNYQQLIEDQTDKIYEFTCQLVINVQEDAFCQQQIAPKI